MKTTLNIDDTLLRRAKAEAASKGCTLTSMVEEGLREVLRGPTRHTQSYRLKLKVAEAGPQAGVDVADRDALHDRMESRS